MKLEPKQASSSTYPKFVNIGDVVEGRFVSFTAGEAGNYGIEDNLRLSRDDGATLTVRCSAMLSAAFRDNPPLAQGQYVKITFTRTLPNTKGKPTKIYDVDVEDLPPPQAAPQRPPTRPLAPASAQPGQRPAARPQAQAPRVYGQPGKARPVPAPASVQEEFGPGDDGGGEDLPF